jgi:hypothetical protein
MFQGSQKLFFQILLQAQYLFLPYEENRHKLYIFWDLIKKNLENFNFAKKKTVFFFSVHQILMIAFFGESK